MNATPWIFPTVLLLGWTFLANPAFGNDITPVVNGPTTPVPAGSEVHLWLNYLNASSHEEALTFPAKMAGRVVAGQQIFALTLELRPGTDPATATISAGAFARRAYVVKLPEGLFGHIQIEFPDLQANGIALDLLPKPAAQPPTIAASTNATAIAQTEKPPAEKKASQDHGPVAFFKEHFFPYEPLYFIAGPDSPNAKFQISFKYRILNSEGPLAQRAPTLKGVHLAYTQTSLWDLNKPSAPFLDTSYKPEFFYSLEKVDRGQIADWFKLDVQPGLQHESNGRDGLASRSLNIAYLRTRLQFGKEDHFQFTLMPRAWAYIGDMSENPDLARYRGYADLRAILGWADGLQLSSSLRMGNNADKGSAMLELSYPMRRLPTHIMSMYLFAQYFTGYGESLLLYNQRSSTIRVGISLFR